MPDQLALLAAALFIAGEPSSSSQEPTDTPGAVGSSQETADTHAALRAILQGLAIASSGADTAATAAASREGRFAAAAASRRGTRADTAAATVAAAACRSRISAFVCRIGFDEDPANTLYLSPSISPSLSLFPGEDTNSYLPGYSDYYHFCCAWTFQLHKQRPSLG
jgi:hypothetical protein